MDDRRVRRTKKALREALSELLLEKELRGITIQELCDRADIHRATFYTHYTDIYDFYEQMENAVVEEIGAIIVCGTTHTYEGVFKALAAYLYDNATTCRMFLDRRGNGTFYNRVRALLEEKYLEILQYETGKTQVTEEWWFFAEYHIQGLLAIVNRWAENGFTYPRDKLTGIIAQIDTNLDRIIPEGDCHLGERSALCATPPF